MIGHRDRREAPGHGHTESVNNDMPPRRILVLTGAGASVNLGVGQKKVPMMSSWASDLVTKLGARADQIGLRPDMPGEDFEKALGSFLAFEKALPLTQPLAHLGAPGAPSQRVTMGFADWFHTATSSVEQIRKDLLANLFENFGRDQIDDAKAARTYAKLHAALRKADGSVLQSEEDRKLAAESYIVHATTNYDTAIETAIQADAHLQLVDGFTSRAGLGSETYTPEVLTGATADSTSLIPVVHLHGAVGWYYRQDGSVTRRPADDGYDDRQIPALLLPDATKVPEGFESPARETWAQFLALLQSSTHAFVIGHSLHDAHVLTALKNANVSTAVLVHSAKAPIGSFELPNTGEPDRIRGLLGDVALIPGDFGSSIYATDFEEQRVVEWLQSTGRRLYA